MIITKSQPMYMPLVRLCAIKERELPYGRDSIDLPSKVVEWSRQLLMYADKEYLLVIPVDTMMKPVGIESVSVGSISAAYVEPREVFKHAILCNARGIVVVHNHPSGNTTPICTNDANVKVKSPATIVCTALKRGMSIGIVEVINEDKAKEHMDFSSVVIETEEYFQILPDTLWILYKTYCSEMRKDIVFKNGRELAAPLKKEEAIMVKTETKSSRATHKINANTEKRFFFIKKTKFSEFSNVLDSF